MTRFLLILTVLAPLAGPVSVALADDPAASLERARVLVTQGDLDVALPILRPLADASDAPTPLLVDAARVAAAVGQTHNALGWLERAAARPDAGEAPRLLGLLRLERGELYPAYLRLSPWVAAHPDDEAARLAAAVCAVQLDRLPDADRLLAPLPDDHPRARLLRGDILVRRTESAAAIAMLEPLLGPSHPPALDAQLRRLLARAYLGARRPDDVKTLLEGRTASDPALALLLSEAAYVAGDIEAALVVLAPHAGSTPTVDRERGRLLILAERNLDAVAALEQATTAAPDDREAWQHLSRARFAAGQRAAAQVAAQRVQALTKAAQPVSHRQTEQQWRTDNPMEQRVREATALRDDGNLEAALAIVREEIILQPQHPRLRLLASGLLASLGRSDEALAEADMAIALVPDLPDAHVRRALAQLSRGDRTAAEETLRGALALEPHHPGGTNQLAILLAERQAYPEALRLLEDLLAQHPDNAVARDNLERLQAQVARTPGAGGTP